MTDSNVTDLFDREEEIFKARLAGRSVRKIAREFHVDVPQVETIIQRHLPTVDGRMRSVAFALELERLDGYLTVFHSKAMEGDPQAGMICLKIGERFASLWGLDAPSQTKVDLVTSGVEKVEVTSTMRIRAALELVAGKTQPDEIEAAFERIKKDPLYADDDPSVAGKPDERPADKMRVVLERFKTDPHYGGKPSADDDDPPPAA
jgi:hypothetical protein